jgi:hypothetical protein
MIEKPGLHLFHWMRLYPEGLQRVFCKHESRSECKEKE